MLEEERKGIGEAHTDAFNRQHGEGRSILNFVAEVVFFLKCLGNVQSIAPVRNHIVTARRICYNVVSYLAALCAKNVQFVQLANTYSRNFM